MFARKNRPATPPGGVPSIPAGRRVYAIGDVHGRRDLLDRLVETIAADAERRGSGSNHLVLLGDLIDRGPDSRGVVERLRTFAQPGFKLTVLCGNHEEVLLRLVGGERGLLDDWLLFGGTECLASYGVDPQQLEGMSEQRALERIRAAIGPDHIEYLRSLSDTVRIGDYLFVHAGVRPGVHLSLQLQRDLRWIRQPFLDDDSDHGLVVVHGHTISPDIVERVNRVGIDTGAYATGKLSAIGLEGSARWFLDATV